MNVILDGREVKVGDKMWSFVVGWGEVTAIDTFIVLKQGGEKYDFYEDGNFYSASPRCLFWDEVEVVPPKPKLKVDKWRWAIVSAYGGHPYEQIPNELYTEEQINFRIKDTSNKIVGRIQESHKVVEE